MLNEIEYLYTCLQEELAEASQCVTKIMRFGIGNRYPADNPKTNLERLQFELADVDAVLDLLEERGQQVRRHGFSRKFAIEAKKAKVKQTMSYSRHLNLLENELTPPPPIPECGPSPST